MKTLTLLALVTLTLISSARADDKTAAVTAMRTWLEVIDAGDYGKSWQEASADFQKGVTEVQWLAAMTGVRVPLGKCESRQLASALQQKDIPDPQGKITKGDYVIAQFETSFANLKYALETVTFVKEGGTWKASGYYVRPRG